ncbi:hypothetical protein ZWY2020_051933 [Hordeum vulgare]|nr:hypothetical protein ZWY2020_051933 [Hordeum vulgare]
MEDLIYDAVAEELRHCRRREDAGAFIIDGLATPTAARGSTHRALPSSSDEGSGGEDGTPRKRTARERDPPRPVSASLLRRPPPPPDLLPPFAQVPSMGQDSGLKRQSNSHSHSRLRPVPELPQTPTRRTNADNDIRRYSQLKCSDAGDHSRSGELRLAAGGHIPNFHCKSLPTRSRLTNAEDIAVAKRGSMYQSSSEITRIRRLQEEGRRKIDSAPSADEFLSFDIVDEASRPSTSGSGSGAHYLFSHQSRRSEAAKSSVETRRVNRPSTKDFLDLSFRELPDESFKLDRPRMDCTLLKNDDAGGGFLEISIEEEEDTARAPCRNAAPHLLDAESGRGAEADRQLNSGVCAGESKHHGERQRVPASNIPDKYVPAKRESASDGTSPSECVNRAT